MCGNWFVAALSMTIFAAAPASVIVRAQQNASGANGPAANGAAANGTATRPHPPTVGSYSLVVTTIEPAPTAHWLNPPPAISVKAGTKLAPTETSGNLTVPRQYAIDSFAVPRQECEETAPRQRGCDALDRTDLAIRDLNTVEYRIVSHGPAVELRVNLQVRDLLPVSHGGASTDWHTGDVIFVSVPKATPVYRFMSETLVGKWNGEPIVFEAGKPLPANAKKGLVDLGVHQDLGDAVLYSYRVK